jgi:ketosteroid isomerase-like protein
MDVAEYLRRYPHEAAFGDEDASVVFDRYHAPGFTLRNDGLPLSRDALVAHMRPARKNVVDLRVDIHEALTDGDRVAARFTIVAAMRRGHTVRTDIHMFGRLAADGRLQEIDQLTRDPDRPAGTL